MRKNMIKAISLLFIIFSLAVFTGCKKQGNSSSPNLPGDQTPPIGTPMMPTDKNPAQVPKTDDEAIENLDNAIKELDTASTNIDRSLQEMGNDAKNSEESLNF